MMMNKGMTVGARFVLVVVTVMVANVDCCFPSGGEKATPPPPTTAAPISCLKARAVLWNARRGGVDPWVPICEENGDYAEDQCHYLTLIMSATNSVPTIYHWKVDPRTGARREDTTSMSHDIRTCIDKKYIQDISNPHVSCSNVRSLILENTADGNMVMLPSCYSDQYSERQCYDEVEVGVPPEHAYTEGPLACWCVHPDDGYTTFGTCNLSSK